MTMESAGKSCGGKTKMTKLATARKNDLFIMSSTHSRIVFWLSKRLYKVYGL